MNLPGIPDYSLFIGEFIGMVQRIGLSTWFNGVAAAAIAFAVAWSAFLFLTGNRLGAQATFIRAMIAVLLFNLGTRPEGAALRSALYDGWRAAHQSAVRTGVQPVAVQLGNSLNSLRNVVTGALGLAGSFAVGGLTAAYLKGGIQGVKAAVRSAMEVGRKVGKAVAGVGGAGAFQAVKSVPSRIGWGALTLTIPYVAAMMISGIMVYIALVIFPLAATALALGYSGLVRVMVTLYLSGLLLGVVAPLVFGASIRMLQNNSIAQIQREVQQVMQEAERIRQQNEGNVQQLRNAAEDYAREVERATGQQRNSNESSWDRFRAMVGGAVASFGSSLANAFNSLVGSLVNMLNALSTWIVSGILSLLLFLLSTLAIIIGSAWTVNRLASAIRV